jgi:hypothetical protein
MKALVYFERFNGEKPFCKWLHQQDQSIRPSVFKKLEIIKREGLNLLGTNSLQPISGQEQHFYELRNVTLNWRIGLYYESKSEIFVLLHGWRHDKIFHKEIERARHYLHEYLESEIKKDDG